MTNEDPSHRGRRDICENELPLGPFSWIEEKSLLVPADKVCAVISLASRLLAGSSQDDDVSNAQAPSKKRRRAFLKARRKELLQYGQYWRYWERTSPIQTLG